MVKNGGSGNTIGPRRCTHDIKSLESKTNTELLKAIDDMMALPAEEIDTDFVNACLDLLQDRAPITEAYDPQKTLDRLHEEHPALFEIEEPPVKTAPKAAKKPKHGWDAMLHQKPEQVNLLGGNVNFSLRPTGSIAGKADRYIPKGHYIKGLRLPAPAEQCRNPSPQQHHRKRLCNVIIRIAVKAGDLGMLVLNRR